MAISREATKMTMAINPSMGAWISLYHGVDRSFPQCHIVRIQLHAHEPEKQCHDGSAQHERESLGRTENAIRCVGEKAAQESFTYLTYSSDG